MIWLKIVLGVGLNILVHNVTHEFFEQQERIYIEKKNERGGVAGVLLEKHLESLRVILELNIV